MFSTICVKHLTDSTLDGKYLLTSYTFERHLQSLNHILIWFQDNQYRVDLRYFKFCDEHFEFHGFVYIRQGLAPDHNVITTLANKSLPRTLSQLRQWTNHVSYYRAFLPACQNSAFELMRLHQDAILINAVTRQKRSSGIQLRQCNVHLAQPINHSYCAGISQFKWSEQTLHLRRRRTTHISSSIRTTKCTTKHFSRNQRL